MDFRLEFGENGRPAYHPADLLKLFLYGYLNKIRSSRDLERASADTLKRIFNMVYTEKLKKYLKDSKLYSVIYLIAQKAKSAFLRHLIYSCQCHLILIKRTQKRPKCLRFIVCF